MLAQPLNNPLLRIAGMLESLSPVFKLPVEVFDDILLLLARAAFVAGESSWCWLAVTHTCRAWRLRALSFPLLWTYLDFTFGGEAWTEECLRRACAAPITVAQPALQRYADLFKHVLASRSPNIASLHVYRANECVGALNVFLKQPAPALRCLHLATSDKALWNFTMYLPRELFAGAALHLHSLELHGYMFQWQTLTTFAGLERLVLSVPSPRHCASHTLIRPQETVDMQPAEWPDVLPALRNLTELRELHLSYCWPGLQMKAPESADAERAASDSIFLPHLQSLTIAGYSVQCAWFLRHVRHPPHTHLGITCLSSPQVARADMSTVTPFLSTRFALGGVKATLSDYAGYRVIGDGTELVLLWDRTFTFGMSRAEACVVHDYALRELGLGPQVKVDFEMEWEEDWGGAPSVMMSGFIF
ncbi:hypothetical protein K488DRAFT_91738 [Vararia minispora EC-137]|uniref:Uncharacterized protein n=1 Tax=Vararia minispora EC-137 TaxID=1314806 RepID=A0ACB8Q549_9AGAM|nr:hypothetical protein K488DRAFT_91738 [Vararia minispora EC-137]